MCVQAVLKQSQIELIFEACKNAILYVILYRKGLNIRMFRKIAYLLKYDQDLGRLTTKPRWNRRMIIISEGFYPGGGNKQFGLGKNNVLKLRPTNIVYKTIFVLWHLSL